MKKLTLLILTLACAHLEAKPVSQYPAASQVNATDEFYDYQLASPFDTYCTALQLRTYVLNNVPGSDIADGTITVGKLSFTIPPALTLTTTGSSGAATYNSGTGALNIPNYGGTTYSAGSGLTLTGTTFSLANSAITLNTHSVSLGGSLSLTYTDVGADASGAAATALTSAEAFSANASNLTSGTIPAARVPTLNQPTTASAGSLLNGPVFTASTGTITLAPGKTLTVSNTLTFTGTDGSSLAIGTGGTLGSNAFTSTAFVPQTTTVNGHALSGNVTVSASDLTTGTLPHAQLPALVSGDIPANASPTSSYAASVGSSTYTTSPSLPVANVKAYGATGNGTTDDTSAINSALAAAPAVYFPAGTYLVSNLTVNANNFLFGDGQASIIKMKSGATGYVIYGNGFAYSVENLAFLGQNNTNFNGTSSPGSQSCLHIDATQNNQVFHAVYIAGFNNMAIGLNGDSTATHQGPALTDLYMSNDWCAIDTGPSGTGQTTALGGANGAEYMAIKGIHATNCYYGCVADSGNVAWIGCNMSYDYCGLYINNASNGSHGSFCESVCNHSNFGMIANGAGSYGYIVGHDYFLGSGQENITVTNTAVTFDHCEFSGPATFLVSANASNEVVTLDSDIWYGAPPTVVNSSSNPATVLWSGLNQVTQVTTLNGYANLASPLQTDSGVSETPNYSLGTAITVANPNFATTGSWTNYVSGWTIAGTGYATSSGSSGVIYQALSGTTSFATYQVTFTISSYVSGSVNLDMGGAYQLADGTWNGRTPPRSASGTYTEICTQDASPNIVIYSHAFSGSITGITVTPIASVLPGTWNCGPIVAAGNLSFKTAGQGIQEQVTNLFGSGNLNLGFNLALVSSNTYTLPAPISGGKVEVKGGYGSGTATIASNSGSQIVATGATTQSASVTLASGATAIFRCAGTYWYQMQ